MESTDVESLHANFERKLVHYCTPTLAAIKPANLFTFRLSSEQRDPEEMAFTYASHIIDALHSCQAKLSPHGVRLEILAPRKRGALIYAYRPTLLKHELIQKNVSEFLSREGYNTASLTECLDHLKERIAETDAAKNTSEECGFPHEIGLFLGYPFDDVMGFIENKGENFLCSGCWKVYTKQRDARECFCTYRNCTSAYKTLFDQGVTLEELACTDELCPQLKSYRNAG